MHIMVTIKKIETMKKTIYRTIFFCLSVIALAGCDLELQKNYDYEASVDDPHVNVTAWEYFQDHQDVFSEFTTAIEYTGLKDYYTQTDNKYTFLWSTAGGSYVCFDNASRGKGIDDNVCLEESMAGCRRQDLGE